MRHLFSSDMIQELALKEGVCIRPVLHQVTDVQTGQTITVVMACRATRESRCPSCAAAARKVRIQQCAEGWHLEQEPQLDTGTEESDDDDVDADLADDNPLERPDEGEAPRRIRSTRRRSEAPDLPVQPVENRTIGQVYEGNLGRRYRPSMFVTLTLPSYGAIVPGRGVPVDPDEYDYRTAALDAMHFTKLLDRWIQNLRRCAGYKVQVLRQHGSAGSCSASTASSSAARRRRTRLTHHCPCRTSASGLSSNAGSSSTICRWPPARRGPRQVWCSRPDSGTRSTHGTSSGRSGPVSDGPASLSFRCTRPGVPARACWWRSTCTREWRWRSFGTARSR